MAILMLGGCQTTPSTIAQPELRLISAAPMQLADSCEPRGSVVVEFTVLADGGTSGVSTPGAPDCLHEALTAWVASFRYAPPGVSVPGTVEWLLVTARRGS